MITGKSNRSPKPNYTEIKPLSELKYIKMIELKGLPSQQIPPAFYSITLFNYINLLDKTDVDTNTELEYMLALSLINDRKFIQACEILRRIEDRIKDNDLNMRSAKLEILIAGCMNQYFQLHEKITAFERAISLYLGKKLPSSYVFSPIKYSNEDAFSYLMHSCKDLIKLLLCLLSDRCEYIQIAAIKSLDFLIENMGCSLGSYVIIILKTMINAFPGNDRIIFSEVKFTSSVEHDVINENDLKISMVKKRLISHYNHLLETYGNVLNSVSSQHLHTIFCDIILPITYTKDLTPEQRLVLLSITDRIINICQGDLMPTPIFLNGILKDQNSDNKKLGVWCVNLGSNCRKQLARTVKTAGKHLVNSKGNGLTCMTKLGTERLRLH